MSLKCLLCGDHIVGVRIRVVHTNKGRLVTTEWRDRIVSNGFVFELAIFVDDSPEQIEAVPGRPEITRLQIVRDGQRYPPNKSGIPVIHSLLELLERVR